MGTQHHDENIRVLIADDDEHILNAYREAFTDNESTQETRALDALAAELFDSDNTDVEEPHFDVVACSQGDDAISLAKKAAREGHPFDVVILDVRMPPGIDGVEAGSQIRKLDPDVFVVISNQHANTGVPTLRFHFLPPYAAGSST